MNKICSILFGITIGIFSSSTYAVVEVPPTFPIVTPADARTHGLEDLRTAINNDGGVPLPDLSDFLNPGSAAKRKLEQLGKVLFWDQQVGSNGQACASCHFSAGADNRVRDQVSPGLLRRVNDRNGNIRGFHAATDSPDKTFQTKSPPRALVFRDFPLIKNIQAFTESGGIAVPTAPNSNDVVSSQGVFKEKFLRVYPIESEDRCQAVYDDVFHTPTGQKVRRVEPRNTPTMINAVLNAFNFWDGRANHEFNGQNPFGVQDPEAKILVFDGTTIVKKKISLKNSSLASQAVGPPQSDFEMSCGVPEIGNGRSWPEIGKKLLHTRDGIRITPLGLQMVDKNDSLIGGLSNYPGTGINIDYFRLIKIAFKEKYWKASGLRVKFVDGATVVEPVNTQPVVMLNGATPTTQGATDPGTDPALTDAAASGSNGPRFTIAEANMALFFGLAVQAYEAKLLADNTSFDKWMRTGNFNSGFGNSERRGLNVFVNKGKCINCHGGPEMTNASVRNFQQGNNLIEPMVMGNNEFAVYDNGFYNIGVTLTTDDVGRGGNGPVKLSDGTFAPLSSSRQRLFEESGIDIPFEIIGRNKVPALTEDENEPVCTDGNANGLCDAGEPLNATFQRAAVDGAMKTPGLRNVKWSGPYFHNGGAATLKQVVEFYNNGGNFCGFNKPDLDPDIQPLGLTSTEKRDLVNFMVSLSDKRVEYRKAPFDHPSLTIPVDGKNSVNSVFVTLPEIGRTGSSVALDTFLGRNPQEVGKAPVNAECSKDLPL